MHVNAIPPAATDAPILKLEVGAAIVTKVRITDGDGCDSPHVLIAEPGDVLQITTLGEDGLITARHHGYPGSHLGFYLYKHEYRLSACLCNQVRRETPCWTTPIPVFDGTCSTCGHLPGCHTHTQLTAPGRCHDCGCKVGHVHGLLCYKDPHMMRMRKMFG